MSETRRPRSLAQIRCAFTRGYVEAAFFSTTDQSREGGADALDAHHSVADLAAQTWDAVVRDCGAFLVANRELVEACAGHHRAGATVDDAMSHAGRDFWYTREGHGAGFWDGDWPEAAGEHLDRSAEAFGAADWYLGDEGGIYQSGDEGGATAPAPALPLPAPSAFPAAEGPRL